MQYLNYYVSVFIILLVSCNNKSDKKKHIATPKQETKTINTTTSSTLKTLLENRKNEFAAKADETVKKIYKEGIDAVSKSNIIKDAKQIGNAAPNFTLTNASGKPVELNTYLKNGPVVLTWYRGGWCPYCNLTLRQLQLELPNFKKYGANLIALTPELPDNSLKTSEKHNLAFEVLSDVGNNVAKEYGVVFQLTKEVAKIYNEKFGLNKYNGNGSNELPLAATYIINQEGKIVYAFLDADYRNRAEPSELTAILKKMTKK